MTFHNRLRSPGVRRVLAVAGLLSLVAGCASNATSGGTSTPPQSGVASGGSSTPTSGKPFVIGASVGTDAEVVRASTADYWGIGPLRATTTKRDAGPALTDLVTRLRAGVWGRSWPHCDDKRQRTCVMDP